MCVDDTSRAFKSTHHLVSSLCSGHISLKARSPHAVTQRGVNLYSPLKPVCLNLDQSDNPRGQCMNPWLRGVTDFHATENFETLDIQKG